MITLMLIFGLVGSFFEPSIGTAIGVIVGGILNSLRRSYG